MGPKVKIPSDIKPPLSSNQKSILATVNICYILFCCRSQQFFVHLNDHPLIIGRIVAKNKNPFSFVNSIRIFSCPVWRDFLWSFICFFSVFFELLTTFFHNKRNPNLFYQITKGQLISKCPLGVIVWTKIPMKNMTNFCPRIKKMVKSTK